MKTYNEEHETCHDADSQSYIDAETAFALKAEAVVHIGGVVHLPRVQTNGDGHTSPPPHEAIASGVQGASVVLGENDVLDPEVPLHCLRLDGGTQSRAAMDDAAIAEYTEAIRQGATLPPLVAYFDGVDFWLADGFHRFHAYRAASVDLVTAEVRTGTQRDAVLFSVGANAAHGLRRTNADKRRAVETLLADAEWAAWSDNQIAKACGVSHPFVGELRRSILKPLQDSAPVEDARTTRTVTRNGTTYEQNTGNIGKANGSVERPATEVAVTAPLTAAPEPIPAPTDTPKDTPIEAADAGELATLRAENAALREELDDLKASFAETLDQNESMGKVFDADDRLQAVVDEIKRLKLVADSAEHTLMAKSGECAEAIRAVKRWKRRAESAEKQLAKGA